uniref:Uncharacterized protein n=1 Tax=Arundo donax TaxID=35708 RepID=A0A0A9EWQ6_ARUDO
MLLPTYSVLCGCLFLCKWRRTIGSLSAYLVLRDICSFWYYVILSGSKSVGYQCRVLPAFEFFKFK